MDSVKNNQHNYYKSSVKADEIEVRKRKVARHIYAIAGLITGMTLYLINEYFDWIPWLATW